MRVEVYLLLLSVATGSAIIFGTRGERWLGATILAGNVLTLLVERILGEIYASVSFGYLALDALLAATLCLIAVRFPSWVAICVAAFQINGTLGHLVKLLAIHTIPFSYAFLLKVWAWPMVLSLFAARCLPAMRTTLLARNWRPLARRYGRP
ncbi:hypothetical protein GCM10022276_11940 [Sphingomonas limnosediminicola]|jgi:hypothetical protein|uniref:Rod shape-determining protein MreD n=2 Tax=Sphingomonas limnosediminicola TaxID=940133 RepID=A0ABP7L5H8_9SPHN